MFGRAELGLEKPQTETLIAKFKERLKDKQVPQEALKVIDEEMVCLSCFFSFLFLL